MNKWGKVLLPISLAFNVLGPTAVVLCPARVEPHNVANWAGIVEPPRTDFGLFADEQPKDLPGSSSLVMKKRAISERINDLVTQSNTHTALINLETFCERLHGQAIGTGQTIDERVDFSALGNLAVHPNFKLQAEKNDEYFEGLVEEDQDNY